MNGLKPMDRIPAVFPNAANERCLAELEWGFLPDWDHRLELRGQLYNLRIETLLESLAEELNNRVREAIVEAACLRRCVIPVAEAFERSREDREMYRLIPKDGEMLYLAGLYSQVQIGQTEELGTVGLITTDHETFGRIPLVMQYPRAVDIWLDIRVNTRAGAMSLLKENRYNGEESFRTKPDKKVCAEPSPEPSPQIKLSLL